MAELDRFDSQLTAAVQAFADRADTEVDAVAIATRAARGRRSGGGDWLGRTVPAPVAMLLLLGLLLVLAMSMVAGGGWPLRWALQPIAVAPTGPISTPSQPPSPSATDARAPEPVSGTESVSLETPSTSTLVDGVTQLRGGVVTVTTSTDDARATGRGTFAFSVDVYGDAGVEWGIFHLEIEGGSWDGPCSGATWDGGDAAVGSCSLVGGGAFVGMSYHRSYSWIPGAARVAGFIYPGPALAP